MKKLLWFVLLASLLTPGLVMAQSVFDGTWKVDMKTAQFPTKPDVYLLQDGMYHCKTCVPPVDIKADGQDQKVTGHPYYDMISVKVVDDLTIEETTKKNGKTNATSKSWVSPDGNTMMFEFSDSSATNADPVTGKGEETRVAKGNGKKREWPRVRPDLMRFRALGEPARWILSPTTGCCSRTRSQARA